MEAVQRGELRGIEGIVSNLITTDEHYARALDVAFGARLSNIVTQRSEDAERAIEFLNRSEQGRATFLPLDTLANREAKHLTADLERTHGVIGYAHTLVRTAPNYEGVVRFLVGNVLIVDTLQTGIHLVRERGFRDTIVTLSGEQITGGGAITGGRFRREKSILSRRVQAQSLRGALADMRAQLDRLESQATDARTRSERAAAARDEAKDALAKLELQIAEVRTEMSALSTEAQRARTEVQTAQAQVAELLERARESRERERGYEGETDEAVHSGEERQRLEAELARAREEIAQAEAVQGEASRSRTRGRALGRTRRREGSPRHARSGQRARAGRARADACRDRHARRADSQLARASRRLAPRRERSRCKTRRCAPRA
jgi:chromosome segregation protein